MTRCSFGATPEAEPGLEELQLSGWFYRLSPRLILSTRRQPPGIEAAAQILYVRSGEAFPPGHPTTRLSLDLLREALAAAPVEIDPIEEAVQPAAEIEGRVVKLRSFYNPQESFLHQVAGIRLVAGQMIGRRVSLFGVGFDEVLYLRH